MIRRKTNDPFLDQDNCIDRLFKEWRTYGKLIIAYDFDNTIYDYYKEGVQFPQVIKLLKEIRHLDAGTFICFTSCDDDRLPYLKEYIKEHDIPLDYLNDNPPFVKFNGRKVYYNVFLDDRAGLLSAYQQLNTVVHMIRIEKEAKKWSKGPKEGY